MTLNDFLQPFQWKENQTVAISTKSGTPQPLYVIATELSFEQDNLETKDFRNKNISLNQEIDWFSFEDNHILISLKS